MRLHFGLVQRLMNNYNNENNILIQHAIYLWVNASIAPNLRESHGLSTSECSPSLASLVFHDHVLVVRAPWSRTRCTGSTTTYSLYGLTNTRICLVCRPLVRVACVACVASASLTSHCVAFLCRSSPSRLSAGVYTRTLTARVSASLSRRFGASRPPLFQRLPRSLCMASHNRLRVPVYSQYTGSPSRSLAFAHPGVDRAYSFRRHDRLGLHRSAKEVRRPPGYRVHRVDQVK